MLILILLINIEIVSLDPIEFVINRGFLSKKGIA